MYIFTNGTLIDGNGSEPIKNMAVTVEGNSITEVGPASKKYPEGAIVVDLNGMVIMPGIIDTHNHVGGVTTQGINSLPNRNIFASAMYAHARKASIEHGVTTVRSAGDVYPDIVRLCEESANLYGPRFFCVGPLFTSVGGGPAKSIFKNYPYLQKNVTRQVDDVEKAREEIRKVIGGGVDFIKVVLGTINFYDLANPLPKMSLEVLEAIIDEAHKANRGVSVHCETPKDAENAVKYGADTVEHIILQGSAEPEVSDSLIRALVDNKVFYSPTLAVNETYGAADSPFTPLLRDLVKRAYDAGVKIVLGTDSGGADLHFGSTAHLEMRKMAEAGMKPLDVIKAATRTAAESLRKEKEFGTLEVGKLADIIVVEGNPAINISDIKNIKMVMRDGNIMVDNLGVPAIENAEN